MPSPAAVPHGRDRLSAWTAELRATLALGLPIVGAQVAQIAVNTTDVLMIGWLGTEELAASVLAFNLYILVWLFGIGILQAVVPLAARARGEKRLRDVRRAVRMGLWLVIAYSLPVWVLLWNTEALLVAIGQEPHVSRLAGDYMRVLQWALLPSLAFMALRSFVTVMEKTQVVLWIAVAGAVANAILDYLLIFGHFGAPRLELVGAGLASVGTGLVTFGLIVVYVLREPRLRRHAVLGRFWRSDWPAFGAILKLGWPIGLTILAEVGMFSGSAMMMGWVGTVPLAAHGIALQCASITFMVPLGLGQAGMIRVGLAAGRREMAGVGRAGWAAIGLSLVFMSLMALVFWTVPDWLIHAFTRAGNESTADVLRHGIAFLAVAALFQIFDGAQVSGGKVLNGLADTRVPMVFALIGYWIIGMPLAYLLTFQAGLGGIGIWWGLAAGLAFVASAVVWRFALRERLRLV